MIRAWLTLLTCVAGSSSLAYAQAAKQDRDTPPKSQPSRVHLGSTSVTVVDEHDTVDDVITRLRKVKPSTDKQEQAKSASAVQTTTAPSDKSGKDPENGRAELQTQRTIEAQHAEADRPKEERRGRASATRVRGDRKQRR